MSPTGRKAVFLSPGKNFDEGRERIRLAESLGYESAWINQIAEREATVIAADFATATKSIGIGTGVLPVYPRTPAVMAQTAATLDELSGGRFILGLGTAHKMTIEAWHNMKLSKPLATMREYVGALRAILRGETFFGEIYKTAFSFNRYETRPDLPIYMSCLSPKMCELAGEIADGAVLWMCSPGYIQKVVGPQIAAGREKAGKSMDGFDIVAAVPVTVTDDVQDARDSFRKMAVVYWNLPFYRAAIAGGGFEGALEKFDSEGPSGIPDEAIDEFAGIGTPEVAKAKIEHYRNAGATLPAVGPLPRTPGALSLEELLKTLA